MHYCTKPSAPALRIACIDAEDSERDSNEHGKPVKINARCEFTPASPILYTAINILMRIYIP
jgi:hypothetical protein